MTISEIERKHTAENGTIKISNNIQGREGRGFFVDTGNGKGRADAHCVDFNSNFGGNVIGSNNSGN